MIAVLRGAVVGVAILVALQLFGSTAPAPRPVSESEGAIGVMYLQFTRAAEPVVAPVYRELLRDYRGKLFVGCPGEEDWSEFESTVGANPNWRPIFTRRPTGAWARDRFIAVRACGGLRLLVPERAPLTPGGDADWRVAWDVARETGAKVRTLPIDFDGGDVWMTSGVALAHDSLIERNGAGVRAILESELGVPVVFVDGAPHHLGMFVTPVDSKTILVANPPASAKQDWAAKLRALPEKLRAQGFRVALLPFEPTDEDRVYVTYNNVLIDGKTVFMPVYDRPELDAAAEAVWRAEGFDVRRIPARKLLPNRGAVHCLVNVLERV